MANLNAYLIFNGNCAEAMRFYERVLGGKLELMTHGDSPMADQTPADSKDRIMHAYLAFDGGVLMASDDMPNAAYSGMHGFSLSLGYSDIEAARKMFEALSEGGQATMPFQETFWSPGFGMLTDRFGTPWMVNVTKERD
jgi:PhnB protein